WPKFLIFDDFNNTLSVLIVFIIVVAYSSLGGIRGVILTDLFQFALAMLTAIVFAVFAVDYVGGLESLFTQIHEIYPGKGEDILRFWPRFDNVLFPFEVFLIFIAVQWWAQYYSDGSGYLAQRMNTARTPADAEKGTLWFTLANFCLRTWPWVVVGLVAVVVFPLDDPTRFHAIGASVADDREMGYPVLMKLILPSGLLGLTFASLMAAFMSTVDTHINWGASYMVNDVYKRFVRPDASGKELVLVSRVSVVLIALIAVMVASQINSIEQAWKFFVSLGAGLGLPQILRWVWWRANAWTEIAGMLVAFLSSVILYTFFPEVRSEYLLFWTVIMSTSVALIVTFSTAPVHEDTLRHFAARTSPIGFWGGFSHSEKRNDFGRRLWMLGLGIITTFGGVFCIGYFLVLNLKVGLMLLVLSTTSFVILLKMMSHSSNDSLS
ncbi:sodium transporter, partial [bacterium]|nr:sodium transporter [bacterium]